MRAGDRVAAYLRQSGKAVPPQLTSKNADVVERAVDKARAALTPTQRRRLRKKAGR